MFRGLQRLLGSRLAVGIASATAGGLVVVGGAAMGASSDQGAGPANRPSAVTYWAKVAGNEDGSAYLAASRGAVSVEATPPGEFPSYDVTFSRDVSGCGWTVSMNNNNFFGPPAGWGEILVSQFNKPGFPEEELSLPDELRVVIYDMDNAPVRLGGTTDTFTVVAHC